MLIPPSDPQAVFSPQRQKAAKHMVYQRYDIMYFSILFTSMMTVFVASLLDKFSQTPPFNHDDSLDVRPFAGAACKNEKRHSIPSNSPVYCSPMECAPVSLPATRRKDP